MITYITREKSTNLGDILSVPNNYFEIVSNSSKYIMGGGQWNIFETPYADVSNTILWSVGVSIKLLPISFRINSLPFLDWTIRDVDLVDTSNFLPCVSCMHHDILNEPEEDETLYYFNADHSLRFGDNILLNNTAYIDFIEKWKKSSTIITNSYHGIYWGLLSNRKVIPIGYSSKFISLFKMFELEFPKDNLYSGKETTFLSAPSMKKFNVSEKYLDRFRSMNLEFADKIRMFDIICKPSIVN